MKTTVTKSDFRDAFHHCGRGEQFSYEALGLIYDYFTEVEDDCGVEIELDPIAVCCEYSEDTPEEVAENFDIDLSDADEDDAIDIVKEYLLENTNYLGMTSAGTMVYQQF